MHYDITSSTANQIVVIGSIGKRDIFLLPIRFSFDAALPTQSQRACSLLVRESKRSDVLSVVVEEYVYRLV